MEVVVILKLYHLTDNCSELEDELLKLQPSGIPYSTGFKGCNILQTKEDNNGLLEQFVV